jgi:hypothetical protein
VLGLEAGHPPTLTTLRGRRNVGRVARTVICVFGSDGAGGDEVPRLVADRLGLWYIAEDIVSDAARRAGVGSERMADVERRKSLVRRVLDELGETGAAGMVLGGVPPPAPVEPRPVRSDELRVFIREAIEARGRHRIRCHSRPRCVHCARGERGHPPGACDRVGGDESEANRRTTRNRRGGRAGRAPSGRCRARRLSPTLLRRAYRASDAVRPRHQHRPAQPRGRGRHRRASGGLTKAGRAIHLSHSSRGLDKFDGTRSRGPYPRGELARVGTQTRATAAALALDDDWPDVLAALRRGIKQPNDAAAARAAVSYVQLVYGRQLQAPSDEQPSDGDALDVASMTREEREALKRKLIAQHPRQCRRLAW